ncbi:fascin domain-containing protein [Paenibacillus pabuli]|uniref:fascin domain-containing protein n=1 Tax=Paenibacillus pabuli TaxID=1472 RepID=UPI003CE97D62
MLVRSLPVKPGGTIALQALANNLYVTCDLNNDGKLVASRNSVGGAWEAFRVNK